MRGTGAGYHAGMGFSIRRTFPIGRTARINVSKRGLSLSAKLGRITLNSRGRGAVRLGKGIGYRFGSGRR